LDFEQEVFMSREEMNNLLNNLHDGFKISSIRYRQAQAELVDYTQKADDTKLYLHRGYNSLFDYVMRDLGLSEATASNIINVARTAKLVPQLKEQLENGHGGVAKLRKLCPVLKKAHEENKPEEIKKWLDKAKNMNTREIESEVAKVSPAPRRKESIRRIDGNHSSLTIGLSDEERNLLGKAQNLASSKNKANMTMAETIVLALGEFVEKYDPTKKAERQKERQQKKESAAQPAENPPVTEFEKETAPVTAVNPKTEAEKTGREAVPAAIVHEVNRRDGGQCAYVSPEGKRCECSRFLHFHHVKPVAYGGKNTVENLITLCSAHHRLIHENEESKKYFPKRK
jgi:5-methylcytosine-specific restriction endonuclease McrA